MNRFFSFRVGLIMVGILIGIAACKKDYVNESTPYNDIKSFGVAYGSNSDSVYAAINGDSLLLYWPGDRDNPLPDSIKPQMIISENAEVSPASGASVALQSGTTFTVKAQNGMEHVYTLYVNNTGSGPSYTVSPLSVTVGQKIEISGGGIGGDYYFMGMNIDNSKNTAVLVDADGKEYKMLPIADTTSGMPNSYGVSGNNWSFLVDTSQNGTILKAGKYSMKMNNGIKSTTSDPFFTITDEPAIPYIRNVGSDTIKVKKGSTLTLPVAHLNNQKDYTIISVNMLFTQIPLGSVSADGNSVTITIPASISTGTAKAVSLDLKSKADGNTYYSASLPLTVPIVVTE